MEKKVKVKLSKYEKLEGKYLTRLHDLTSKDKEAKHIKASLLKGKNEFLRVDRIESASYDMEWVSRVEDCLPELGTIINNPKKTIKTVTDIVPVELAKKTGPESIRHLSMNSQFVKSVDKKGNITPEKILNISSDDDYHIYENRFIAMLIKHLVIFVEKRYEYLTKYAPFTDAEMLHIKSDSVVDGSKVEMEMKIRVEKNAEDVDQNIQTDYMNRVDNIRTYMRYYLNSEFMKMFKTDKSIGNNIIMTNILRKNPAYHKCYELYKFISKYNKVGVTYKIKEEFHNVTKKQQDDLSSTLLANFLALEGSDPSRVALEKEKVYEPKISHTLDDDLFVFEPISNKPLEFVRIDDEYKKFIDDTYMQIELEKKRAKEEAKFQEEELKRKRDELIKQKALEKLMERKAKLAEAKAKREEELRIAFEAEEAKRKEQEEIARKIELAKQLEEVRKYIRAEARSDRKKEENARKEKRKQLEREEENF